MYIVICYMDILWSDLLYGSIVKWLPQSSWLILPSLHIVTIVSMNMARTLKTYSQQIPSIQDSIINYTHQFPELVRLAAEISFNNLAELILWSLFSPLCTTSIVPTQIFSLCFISYLGYPEIISTSEVVFKPLQPVRFLPLCHWMCCCLEAAVIAQGVYLV